MLSKLSVRVANELGAGNAKGAKFATKISVLTSLVVGLLFWSITIAFHEKLAMIFTSSTSVIAMVNKLAVLLAFTILLNCIQPVLSGEILNKHCVLAIANASRVMIRCHVLLCRGSCWIWLASCGGFCKLR